MKTFNILSILISLHTHLIRTQDGFDLKNKRDGVSMTPNGLYIDYGSLESPYQSLAMPPNPSQSFPMPPNLSSGYRYPIDGHLADSFSSHQRRDNNDIHHYHEDDDDYDGNYNEDDDDDDDDDSDEDDDNDDENKINRDRITRRNMFLMMLSASIRENMLRTYLHQRPTPIHPRNNFFPWFHHRYPITKEEYADHLLEHAHERPLYQMSSALKTDANHYDVTAEYNNKLNQYFQTQSSNTNQGYEQIAPIEHQPFLPGPSSSTRNAMFWHQIAFPMIQDHISGYAFPGHGGIKGQMFPLESSESFKKDERNHNPERMQDEKSTDARGSTNTSLNNRIEETEHTEDENIRTYNSTNISNFKEVLDKIGNFSKTKFQRLKLKLLNIISKKTNNSRLQKITEDGKNLLTNIHLLHGSTNDNKKNEKTNEISHANVNSNDHGTKKKNEWIKKLRSCQKMTKHCMKPVHESTHIYYKAFAKRKNLLKRIYPARLFVNTSSS